MRGVRNASEGAAAETLRLLLEQERGALAPVRRASRRLGQRNGIALSKAADNLLAKAVRRFEDGEPAAARALVARALALPVDEHEQQVPALWSAHMALYRALAQDAQASAVSDSTWLDRIELLLEGGSEATRTEIRRAAAALLDLELTNRERQRLRQLTHGVGHDEEPFGGIDDPDARIDAILGTLAAVERYQELVDASEGPR